jgi:hypothetical protein
MCHAASSACSHRLLARLPPLPARLDHTCAQPPRQDDCLSVQADSNARHAPMMYAFSWRTLRRWRNQEGVMR